MPPHIHRRNAAERAVRNFRNQFIAALCTVDPLFPFYLWERLLPEVTVKLNMLWQSQLNLELPAYEQVGGIHNFERTPLEPLGCKVKFTKNLISVSPNLPTESMDGTLDQQSIIIDTTPDITLILEGKLNHIQ